MHILHKILCFNMIFSRKSNDAAVGKLVDMLKKAQPLYQDFYPSEHPSVLRRQQAIPTSAAIQEASIASSKTTSDALDECDDYMEMKNWLVSKPQV